ncbi:MULTISPECIES: hypothetical protein [unclassified Saccharopolyspora]|uniref:MmyB family transcriptional regulator n=1 Tax=unclassified Saccharopolyspora TaxID=2646250 RepID=UPI001CD2F87F|nr:MULTISPECIES: hypothetical protein [unclassified Saccharopolyspora]MCA1189081.1 hypothetical protein [Saccharopolyspora sp. 6T]MCA1282213.1 hypothetical protein [Saccharopolyspora sp. 7B]
MVSARFDVLAWHPVVGEVTVDCDSLALTDRDQHLVLYTAQPGSRDAEAPALLDVLGAERFDAGEAPRPDDLQPPDRPRSSQRRSA